MQVVFHRLASAGYLKARRWYGKQSPTSARRFQSEMQRALEKIVDDPRRWPVFRLPFHWVKMARFPYAVYYEVAANDEIWIMAVAHLHRRIGYWLRRNRS